MPTRRRSVSSSIQVHQDLERDRRAGELEFVDDAMRQEAITSQGSLNTFRGEVDLAVEKAIATSLLS